MYVIKNAIFDLSSPSYIFPPFWMNHEVYLSLRSTNAVLSLQVLKFLAEREDKERIRYQNEPRHMLLEPTTESV